MNSIVLNQSEQRIRTLLVDFCSYYDSQPENAATSPLVLRITGGWVRDKLLGLGSDDLDIAINNLTGVQFAELLNEYIASNSDTLGMVPSNLHKIEKNPEKSKHLETVTTKLYDLDIDFVNLRSEEYAEDSRIPKIKFGTAAEDAYRRDATLNALFYNLQTEQVEDLTERGINDLQSGVLRTPLPPFNTFHEDPLRVLRLVRFAARFGFKIAPETTQAMADPTIKTALIQKISRERVGVEIEKTLAAKYTYKGLQYIADLGLDDAIFHLFDTYQTRDSGDGRHHHRNFADAVLDIETVRTLETLPSELKSVVSTPKTMTLLWLCGCLSKWTTTAVIEKNKPTPAAQIVVATGLKLPINDGKVIAKTLSDSAQVNDLVDSRNYSRTHLIRLLRPLGQNWRLTFAYGLSQDLARLPKYQELLDAISQEQLGECWATKPIANGKEILTAYQLARAGPWLSQAVELGVVHQLEHPEKKKLEILDYLISIRGTIGA